MTPFAPRLVVPALALLCLVPSAQENTPPRLTVERALELDDLLRIPDDVFLAWMPDSASFVAADAGADGARVLVTVAVEGGERRALLDPDVVGPAFAADDSLSHRLGVGIARRANAELSIERDGALLDPDDRLHYSLAHRTLLAEHNGDLYAFDGRTNRAVRLTDDSEPEIAPQLSPDGTHVAFVRANDVHVVPLAGGASRALTKGGDATHLHGRLDWVYQEEVYGRGNFQGFWWSPDSKRIAVLVLDESNVPVHAIVEHDEARSKAPEVLPYPRPGDPNPIARLAVVDVAGGEPRFLDLSVLSVWRDPELLIARVGWTPNGEELWLELQDRAQTWLDLCLADPVTGDVRRILHEETPAWCEPNDGPLWLDEDQELLRRSVSLQEVDGKLVPVEVESQYFLWLTERHGYRHLYRHSFHKDGAGNNSLTHGEWEVETLHGCDAAGMVWFDADRADSKGKRLYRVPLSGGEPVEVTTRPGVHTIAMSPDRTHFVDRSSSLEDFGRAELCRASGEVVRTLHQADAELVHAAGLVAPKFVTAKTPEGVPLEAMLFEPADFDPTKKYPVVSFCYGGPGAPKVRDANLGRDGLFHRMLAQEGYLVWVCDNRSASGKGLAWAQGVRGNLGAQELGDLEDGLDWLVAQGCADPERIALWGWSYGGFLTAYALTHSDRFKLGIAGAPVTDWRLYDSIYTERLMGLLDANREGYERTSVIAAAGELSGKLLLIHGTRDENVHLGNTLQLAEALQRAGKPFDLMLYPGNRHRVSDPAQRRHLYETMANYIRANL